MARVLAKRPREGNRRTGAGFQTGDGFVVEAAAMPLGCRAEPGAEGERKAPGQLVIEGSAVAIAAQAA